MEAACQGMQETNNTGWFVLAIMLWFGFVVSGIYFHLVVRGTNE